MVHHMVRQGTRSRNLKIGSYLKDLVSRSGSKYQSVIDEAIALGYRPVAEEEQFSFDWLPDSVRSENHLWDSEKFDISD